MMSKSFRIGFCLLGLAFAACQPAGGPTEKASGSAAADTLNAATPVVNALTEEEKEAGWVSLFDGQTTRGWHVYQQKTDGSAWKVADGCIYLDTSRKEGWQVIGGGDLITDSAYENYHFSAEWRIAPGGNSGIIFGIQDKPAYEHSWHTGLEMQVLDNEAHPDRLNPRHRAGDLYDLIAVSRETVKPAGEWNRAEIVQNKGQLTLSLNGERVVETGLWDDNWKKILAGSKFRDMPDFGKFSSGHIGLQDHGDMVWYRNVRIRKL